MERLQSQIEFLLTCDRLKSVVRTTYLHDASLPENSAEHSWHLTLMALTLEEYAPAGTVVSHAVKYADCVHIPANAAPDGSSVASVHQARFPSSGQQDSGSQEIELGSPVHLPFQQFDARHLALHLPITPGRRNGTQHSGGIFLDAARKAFQFQHRAGAGLLNPGGEASRRVQWTRPQEAGKVLNQGVDGATDRGGGLQKGQLRLPQFAEFVWGLNEPPGPPFR